MPNWDVIVVGAGAAGLLAAAHAAERGRRTLLLEKNRKCGVKILMSGGTRCNLTQATDARGIALAFGNQGKFLHSPLASLGPQDLVALIEADGVRTKVEPTGKIFPASDKAADVLEALLRRMKRSGATLATGEPVREIMRVDAGLRIVTVARTSTAESVILTTGGLSYAGCGTTGDGYAWAKGLGHTIVPPRPALVPVTTPAEWVHALKGITIPDVAVRVRDGNDDGGPATRLRLGSFLFTHFGVSGPVVLDVSREITGHPDPEKLVLECDYLPSLRDAEFDELLRNAARSAGKKSVAGILPDELPRRLAEALLARAQVDPDRRAAESSAAERARLVRAAKHSLIPVSGTLGFPKAEVTAGGVALGEVDSRTMRSRIVPPLFLAGEVLDLDGPIGGYNFQAAFSTGWLAGGNA
jgi:hypothetical protein